MKHMKKLLILALMLYTMLLVLPMSAAAETVVEKTDWMPGYVSADGTWLGPIEIDTNAELRIYYECSYSYPWVYVSDGNSRIEADSFDRCTYPDNGYDFDYGCYAKYTLEPGSYSIALTSESAYSGGGAYVIRLTLTYEAHTHSYEYDRNVKPTCSERGYTEYTCSCGDSYKEYYGEKLPHTEAASAEVAPTCQSTGRTAGTYCSVCGTTISGRETISKVDHAYVNNVCTYCGRMIGTCGDNLEWALDNGKLTISGSGEMHDYEPNGGPWYSLRDKVKSVKLSSDMNSIGDYAFQGLAHNEIKIYSNIKSVGKGAFLGCEKLEYVTISNGVKSIGESAFRDCIDLDEIDIPDSVETIGSHAFAGCDRLSEVMLPHYLTELPPCLFENCWNLYSLNIPMYVTEIGENVFKNCSSLSKLKFPDDITSLPEGLLSGCTDLKTVTLPKKLAAIPDGFFSGCVELTEVNLPKNIAEIPDHCFSGCAALTTLTIPDSVTTIGNSAFSDCAALAKINIPAGVTAIGNNAFSGCAALSKLDIPAGVTAIGEYAFQNCTSLTELFIPDSVTSVGRQAFSGCTGMMKMTIAGDAPVIGAGAFKNMTATVHYNDAVSGWEDVVTQGYGGSVSWSTEHTFKSVKTDYTCTEQGYTTHTCTCGYQYVDSYKQPAHRIDDGLCTECGKGGTCGDKLTWEFDETTGILTISGTGSMTNYTRPTSNRRPPWYDLRESIIKVVVEDGVTSIGEYAFYDYDGITDVSMGKTVESIRQYAFYWCDNLSQIELPAALKTIGGSAFSSSGLKECGLPQNVTTIGAKAFAYSKLQSCTIPESVSTIGDAAFTDTKLTVIDIPSSVTNGGVGIFRGCKSLKKVTIACPRTFDDMFENCTGLVDVILTDNVKTIGAGTFRGCESLAGIEIPDSITRIEGKAQDESYRSGAFSYCSNLVSVTIPESMTYIGSLTFNECTSLTSITIPASVETVENAFEGCSALETVYFEGDECLNILYSTFEGVSATAYYPTKYATYWEFSIGKDWGGSIKWVKYDPCDTHTYGEWKRTTESTCTKAGLETSTCANCEVTKTRTVATLEHTWDEGTVSTEPTEEATGSMRYTCTVCSKTKYETIPKLEHVHKYNSVVTAPTCTEKGYTTYTCSKCGDSYVADEMAALDHDMSDWVITDATCTVDGSKYRTCSRCGEVETKAIPALNHNLTDKITAATCTTDGIKVTTCSRCDYSETEVLPATGHSHVPAVTAPTCTEGGYTTHTCHCGDSYVSDEVPALDHSITYAVETVPTLESEGTLVGTCTRCGKTTRIVLPKLGKTAYSIEVITEPNKEAEGFGRYTWNVTDYGTFTFEAAIPNVILGDVNDDDAVNVLDLMYLANYFAKGEIINQANADVNGDGLLDVRDLMFLANVFAGKETLS